MCLIIDTNTFGCVFSKDNKDHSEFSPILKWIIEGNGKIVFGGSKYREELKLVSKYLKIIGNFNRIGKVKILQDIEIDKHEVVVKGIEQHKDFDDPHLVAIAYISKCQIICSKDKRAYPFLNDKRFYPNNSPRPKIYSGKQNANLLCDQNIANICLPCLKLTKAEAKSVT